MPRGTDRYDEARLQGRLFDATNCAVMPKTYINFNRRQSLVITSGTITNAKNLGKGGDDFSTSMGSGSIQSLSPTVGVLPNGRSVGKFIAGSHTGATCSALGQPTTNGLTPADPTYTVIVLQRISPGGSGQRGLGGGKDENFIFGFYGFSNAMHQWYSGTFNVTSPPTLVSGVFQLSTFRSPSTHLPDVRANGAKINGANLVQAAPICFGVNTDSFGEMSDCEIFAFAAWYGYLSDADTYKVEGAFAWEAGVQDTALAANHPYRNRPPLIGD